MNVAILDVHPLNTWRPPLVVATTNHVLALPSGPHPPHEVCESSHYGTKRWSSPIIVTERWTRSWSRCTGSQPAGDFKPPTSGILPLLSAKPVVTSVAFTRRRQPFRQWHTADFSSLLIYRSQKDERLSWPSWLTCSGCFNHNSGHPSAEVELGTGNVRRRETDVLPLCNAGNGDV